MSQCDVVSYVHKLAKSYCGALREVAGHAKITKLNGTEPRCLSHYMPSLLIHSMRIHISIPDQYGSAGWILQFSLLSRCLHFFSINLPAVSRSVRLPPTTCLSQHISSRKHQKKIFPHQRRCALEACSFFIMTVIRMGCKTAFFIEINIAAEPEN